MEKLSCNYNRNIWGILFFICTILTSCTDELAPIAVSSVILDPISMTLIEGESQKLTVTVSPSNAENKTVIWTSSNSSVASVKEGLVTAIKAGKTTVTVKSDDGGKTATCEVTVNAKVYPVESVSLDKTSYEMTEGDEFSLTASVKPDNATNKNVKWSSSNTFVATVSNGKVTALQAGSTTITVKTDDGDKTATCEVIVKEAIKTDISAQGTANCYIVSEAGFYKFTPSKGNSNESVGTITSVEVLWETFGTDVTPNVGDLLKNVVYSDGYIAFQTADTFNEGNAVIAAKDASGTILWSWHIWLTDEPQGQEYYNNAGTMMDRNLGATSATPGDVGALGLLYQWGRKDPFLGSSSIHDDSIAEAKSTITWPSAVSSDASNGTIEYATANSTTFITRNLDNNDWYYTGNPQTDNTRWTESDKSKSIYDPCPQGWRVPDGGSNGVWSTALGSSSSLYDDSLYSRTNEGMNFPGKFGSARIIWYPLSYSRNFDDGSYEGISRYWSASPSSSDSNYAYYLRFLNGDVVAPAHSYYRAFGCSVRCLQEGTTPSTPAPEPVPEAVDLSEDGTANSYIVSQKGAYKFSTVKGNSSESVGDVASAEVLWESFGTDVTPNVGDLVKNAVYSDGYIAFQTADTFKEGNAVIAAKDASDNILWSWHIWLTDEPQGQVYYNNAGTMMDRNLGATSATPGDVGALGLLYQWGRKDPFLGSSSIHDDSIAEAKSTITWPSVVESNSTNGTIEYASANPTTFITLNSDNKDWYYTGNPQADNTRWTESDKAKSIYDPCPQGWRVPDGGNIGIWSTALGSSSSLYDDSLYSSTNEGLNFSVKFGSASTIWYPASGSRLYNYGSLNSVGIFGRYWSASPDIGISYTAYSLRFGYDGSVIPAYYEGYRANGYSVRCLQESK